MNERPTCDNCRFGVAQSCRRHAPLAGNESHESPRWPIIVNMSLHWCGDHEPRLPARVPAIVERCRKLRRAYVEKYGNPPLCVSLPQDDCDAIYDEAGSQVVSLFGLSASPTSAVIMSVSGYEGRVEEVRG